MNKPNQARIEVLARTVLEILRREKYTRERVEKLVNEEKASGDFAASKNGAEMSAALLKGAETYIEEIQGWEQVKDGSRMEAFRQAAQKAAESAKQQILEERIEYEAQTEIDPEKFKKQIDEREI